MMKKIVLGVMAVITFQASAQINSELKAHYEAYYNQMRTQGDVRGAINALTHLNMLDPEQICNQYLQALNVIGAEQNTNDSDLAVQIKAVSLKSLNQPQLAVKHYKVLFDRQPDASKAYELADLNMQLEKLTEAKTYLDYGLENAKDEDKLGYYESNPPYEVPLKAAFLYLKGLYQFNQNKTDIDTAVKSLDEAIIMAPNFSLAKQIKEAMLRQKGQ